MKNEKILVTGAAGFIGYHTAKRLLADGHTVVGLDNLNPYYDPSLKRARLERLAPQSRFSFFELDVADRQGLAALFEQHRFDRVIHLAAQAGVRYSIENPHAYVDSNLVGFVNILELVRAHPVAHFVYASSSSVYGDSAEVPFHEGQNVDHPISLYAATKKSNELIAHVYAHLFAVPVTGLRFFTVYGPWGRPDMAIFKFTDAILSGKKIDVYNNGDMLRDFTYIDDIVEGVVRITAQPPQGNGSAAPYQLFNIGNNDPVRLMDMISILESLLGRKASIAMLPMQPGDVYQTYASVDALAAAVGYRPQTPLSEGLKRFVEWYLGYFFPKQETAAARPS